VVILIIPGDPVLFGIPLFKALIGATLFAALWYLLTYLYWLLRTSVRKIGLLGFHRPPLSGGQVGLSHRSRRERVFVHKRKHGGMGSRLTRKACPGCMRELQKTSLGMMLRARWTRSTSCPREHVVRLQAAQW